MPTASSHVNFPMRGGSASPTGQAPRPPGQDFPLRYVRMVDMRVMPSRVIMEPALQFAEDHHVHVTMDGRPDIQHVVGSGL